jgi:drug/metabolite transporter (DMT)-like permease
MADPADWDGAGATRASLALAFATLYVVWGSTYLAIRIAVVSWPPLLMAAVRFAVAGGGLYAFLRARGVAGPSWRGWGASLLVGGLLLAAGNGVVCWSEQWLPSGEASLIIATTPLWMTLLPWAAGGAPAPRPLVFLGVAAGLVGVATLLGAKVGGHAGAVGSARIMGARMGVLIAALSWSVGSLWSRRLPLPGNLGMAAAAEMLAASPILLIAGAARGEWHRLDIHSVTRSAWLAVGYLITFGSLAGFGSYVYLLKHTSPARTSTYAFVNPLVAVALGTVFARETFGPRMMVAAALIVGAVAAVVAGTGAPRDGVVGAPRLPGDRP